MPCLGQRHESSELIVDLNRSDPFRVHFECPQHVFSLQLGPRNYEIALGSDRFIQRQLAPGAVTFSPQGTTVKAVSDQLDSEFLAFSVGSEMVQSTLDDLEVETSILRVEPNFNAPSNLALGRVLRSMLEAGTISDLSAQSATALLLHNFVSSLKEHHRDQPRRGLPEWRCRRVEEYIDAHLGESISLSALAAVAGLSPFHFSREFKSARGRSPHAFVLEKRVERAQRLILATRLSLAEIATSTGFCSQAHMTGVFRRLIGSTPGRIRREG